MADSDGIAPHQHQWHLLMKDGEEPRVMPHSSCAICGLTPEAVANAAAIETLQTRIEQLRARTERYNTLNALLAQKETGMMATTDERLAEIRAYLDYPEVRQDEAMFELGRLVPPVLAEYAAAMAIVRAVATMSWPAVEYSAMDDAYVAACPFNERCIGTAPDNHELDCPVTKARALLAHE